MKTANLTQDLAPAVQELMALGEPYVRVRTDSDYWLYARLFSTTCLVALDDRDLPLAAVIAFRSQDDPGDVYIQDVITHPGARRTGAASSLITELAAVAARLGCTRLWLTSEPDNTSAHATWLSLGFINVAGDRTIHGVAVINDFKGPGKHRSVYERRL